jgi:hypothetical protein
VLDQDSGIFEQLDKLRWRTAFRTYGNDHATLIGLIVDWWVSLRPDRNSALEGGPGNREATKGLRGQCDAILCSDAQPVVVLEVEGTRVSHTIDKLRTFLTSTDPELRLLQSGILLLYAYEPKGHGKDRCFLKVMAPDISERILETSKKCGQKEIIVITVDKTYQKQVNGIRLHNEYYYGKPNKAEAFLFVDGKILQSKVLSDTARMGPFG